MVDIVGEARMFAGAASGVLVNLDASSSEQRAAAPEAVRGATASGTPWALDSVAIGTLLVRTTLAQELAERHPTVICGKAYEILALAGLGEGGCGVDATDGPEAPVFAAGELAAASARSSQCRGTSTCSLTVPGGIRIANGHELLTRVTGGGCALGAVMVAFLGAIRARAIDLLVAVAAGSLVYTIAAERAAAASGPGSFAVSLLDEPPAVQPKGLAAMARVEEDAL